MDDPVRLRELALWYREFAERTTNTMIWECRLRTADDLDEEAARLERHRFTHSYHSVIGDRGVTAASNRSSSLLRESLGTAPVNGTLEDSSEPSAIVPPVQEVEV
jgi:hypothetical protein